MILLLFLTVENIMKALLEHRADINVKADNGETPLHVSLRQKSLIIQNFITPDLNPNETNNEGISYLMLAAEQGDVDLCRELINLGANCSIMDSKGNSALHYACKTKSLSLSLSLSLVRSLSKGVF